MITIAAPSFAADLTAEFDARHKTCLERIADDADLAFEEAMIWRGEGGGRRAKHCEAMALFALGHSEEAARRLDLLADAPDGGTNEMRTDYRAEAANFWLMANQPHQAYDSATAGLELNEDDVSLRIARARAYALLERYDYAEIDLTSALVFEPENAEALRFRADARFKNDDFDGALADIEKSLHSNPNSVETALLRGRIKEAIRISSPSDTITEGETE